MRGGQVNEYAMSTGGGGGVQKGRKNAYILNECPLVEHEKQDLLPLQAYHRFYECSLNEKMAMTSYVYPQNLCTVHTGYIQCGETFELGAPLTNYCLTKLLCTGQVVLKNINAKCFAFFMGGGIY